MCGKNIKYTKKLLSLQIYTQDTTSPQKHEHINLLLFRIRYLRIKLHLFQFSFRLSTNASNSFQWPASYSCLDGSPFHLGIYKKRLRHAGEIPCDIQPENQQKEEGLPPKSSTFAAVIEWYIGIWEIGWISGTGSPVKSGPPTRFIGEIAAPTMPKPPPRPVLWWFSAFDVGMPSWLLRKRDCKCRVIFHATKWIGSHHIESLRSERRKIWHATRRCEKNQQAKDKRR